MGFRKHFIVPYIYRRIDEKILILHFPLHCRVDIYFNLNFQKYFLLLGIAGSA